MDMQDPQLAALYQQYLSGGTPRGITAEVQMPTGPRFAALDVKTPGDWMAVGEKFGGGLMDYLNKDDKPDEEEQTAEAGGTPTSFTPTPLAPVPLPLDAPGAITTTDLPPYDPSPVAPPQGPQRPLDAVLGLDFANQWRGIFGR